MQAMQRRGWVSVDEYLSLEERSEIKHEYLGGILHPMAGGSPDHNQIAGNLFAALHRSVWAGGCRLYFADVKVRLHLGGEDIFYYPDLVVTCDPRDPDGHFLRHPNLIVEVHSDSTEGIDRREKFLSYLSYISLESLEEYVLVAQDKRQVTIFRRSNQWQSEVLTKLENIARLTSIDFVMPLSVIYEGVKVG